MHVKYIEVILVFKNENCLNKINTVALLYLTKKVFAYNTFKDKSVYSS